MRWTIVILAIFAFVAMVTSNAVYNEMEEVTSSAANVFLGGEHNQVDLVYGPPMSKRYYDDWRRRRREEEERRRRHRRW
ncbi:unnamed protein product [Adineta steineri]|uniref:Uncharacterized protein n=1 Tax=Adineta steineri TaxID=433720 RepID=A0A815ARF2_9BILA|nr:unnamed protein product [Adineta steineri]CAF1260935.1 unnamed protein product [Adineta steineri]CAF4066718.1 unnamed protein product [Adineta steineri]CAF4109871.1 unnamed protein product [Adineta steineri]